MEGLILGDRIYYLKIKTWEREGESTGWLKLVPKERWVSEGGKGGTGWLKSSPKERSMREGERIHGVITLKVRWVREVGRMGIGSIIERETLSRSVLIGSAHCRIITLRYFLIYICIILL